MKRISNRDTSSHVKDRCVFKNYNDTLWGEWYEQGIPETGEVVRRYCVYSYRYSWPLFVAETGADGEVHWFENIDRFSVTTSRHKTQAHPRVPTTLMTVGAMRRIVREGMVGLVVHGEA